MFLHYYSYIIIILAPYIGKMFLTPPDFEYTINFHSCLITPIRMFPATYESPLASTPQYSHGTLLYSGIFLSL